MDNRGTERWLSELRKRRRWTPQDARRVLDAREASGASVAAFARKTGLTVQRLSWWRKRLKEERATEESLNALSTDASPPAFVPVTVRRAPRMSAPETAVVVHTDDGFRIEVLHLDAASATWVAVLLRSIGEVRQ